MFFKKMLPDMVVRGMSPKAQAHYDSAFPSVASRKAVRQWPREIPIDRSPADNCETIEAYGEWCRKNFADLEVVDIGDGIHFIQEDNPHSIGLTATSPASPAPTRLIA